jgi:hypothetical protein
MISECLKTCKPTLSRCDNEVNKKNFAFWFFIFNWRAGRAENTSRCEVERSDNRRNRLVWAQAREQDSSWCEHELSEWRRNQLVWGQAREAAYWVKENRAGTNKKITAPPHIQLAWTKNVDQMAEPYKWACRVDKTGWDMLRPRGYLT